MHSLDTCNFVELVPGVLPFPVALMLNIVLVLCQGVSDTVLFSQDVIVAPLQVLVSVSPHLIHHGCKGSIRSCIPKVSRRGMDPSGLVACTVNLTYESMEFICSRNLSLSADFCTTNVSPTYLLHNFGEWPVLFIALIS